MMKTICNLGAAVCALMMVSAAFAGPAVVYTDKNPVIPPPPPPCFDPELTVDIFGGYTWKADTSGSNTIGDGWGGGVGFNWFPWRAWGFKARYFYQDNDIADDRNDVALSLMWRCLAFDSACFSPYLLGGGGGNFGGNNRGTGHLGGGFDWRFAEKWGLFTEGRYTWVNANNNFADANVGIRIKF